MPAPFQQPHWDRFVSIPFHRQGQVGKAPANWVNDYHLQGVPNVDRLSRILLNRELVRDICRNPDFNVLFGYVCTMAWGEQGADSRTRRYVGQAWNMRNQLSEILSNLRNGNITRAQAYALFRNGNANVILGLGPAFFTKLLYFFSPTSSFYIMDKWTAKSVNLLTGENIVDTANFNGNGAEDYVRFCAEIDSMAALLGCSGPQIEERLFSKGRRPPPEWPWRAYVRQHYP